MIRCSAEPSSISSTRLALLACGAAKMPRDDQHHTHKTACKEAVAHPRRPARPGQAGYPALPLLPDGPASALPAAGRCPGCCLAPLPSCAPGRAAKQRPMRQMLASNKSNLPRSGRAGPMGLGSRSTPGANGRKRRCTPVRETGGSAPLNQPCCVTLTTPPQRPGGRAGEKGWGGVLRPGGLFAAKSRHTAAGAATCTSHRTSTRASCTWLVLPFQDRPACMHACCHLHAMDGSCVPVCRTRSTGVGGSGWLASCLAAIPPTHPT